MGAERGRLLSGSTSIEDVQVHVRPPPRWFVPAGPLRRPQHSTPTVGGDVRLYGLLRKELGRLRGRVHRVCLNYLEGEEEGERALIENFSDHCRELQVLLASPGNGLGRGPLGTARCGDPDGGARGAAGRTMELLRNKQNRAHGLADAGWRMEGAKAFLGPKGLM